MVDNILESIRPTLNIPSTDTTFDNDLTMFINTNLQLLKNFGANRNGPMIEDGTETWSSWIDDNLTSKEVMYLAKTYIQNKTKLNFDPPSSATVVECMNRCIGELEVNLISMLTEDIV